MIVRTLSSFPLTSPHMEGQPSSSRRHHEREHDSKSRSGKRHRGDGDDARRSHRSHKTHRHSDDTDSKRHRSSRHKHHSSRKGDDESGLNVVDDDGEEDVWVEKDITEDGDRVRVALSLLACALTAPNDVP